MGMFDTIRWRCPHCNERHSTQTKAGPCELLDYDLARGLPRELVHSVEGDHLCDCCGKAYRIGDPEPGFVRVDIWAL